MCVCVCADLKENGVRGTMYNREFVTSILELIGTNCPEVSGGVCVCDWERGRGMKGRGRGREGGRGRGRERVCVSLSLSHCSCCL